MATESFKNVCEGRPDLTELCNKSLQDRQMKSLLYTFPDDGTILFAEQPMLLCCGQIKRGRIHSRVPHRKKKSAKKENAFLQMKIQMSNYNMRQIVNVFSLKACTKKAFKYQVQFPFSGLDNVFVEKIMISLFSVEQNYLL